VSAARSLMRAVRSGAPTYLELDFLNIIANRAARAVALLLSAETSLRDMAQADLAAAICAARECLCECQDVIDSIVRESER
jgi:hypothetical protein